MPVAPNEPPQFPSNTAARAVDENTVAGRDIGEPVAATDPEDDTLTYSLDTAGAASFDIDAPPTGQLRTKADLDHEATATYFVTVTATDTAGATGTITVTITVNNVEEPGTVTLSSLQPQVRFQLTATLDDPDDVRGSVTWSWAGSQNGDSSSWTPSVGQPQPPTRRLPPMWARYLRATASYTDGEGSGKSAEGVSTNRVRQRRWRRMTRPSSSSRARPRRATWTRTRHGAWDIGEPVTATDPEDNTLTYSLDVDGAASFDINKDTGQLRTKAALDYETGTRTYTVTVTATDTAGATGTITVFIDVNNLDEPGTVTLSSQQPLVAIRFTATLDDLDDVLGSETWLWERSPNGASDWTPSMGKLQTPIRRLPAMWATTCEPPPPTPMEKGRTRAPWRSPPTRWSWRREGTRRSLRMVRPRRAASRGTRPRAGTSAHPSRPPTPTTTP